MDEVLICKLRDAAHNMQLQQPLQSELMRLAGICFHPKVGGPLPLLGGFSLRLFSLLSGCIAKPYVSYMNIV